MDCLHLVKQKSVLRQMRRKFWDGRLQGLTGLQEMGSDTLHTVNCRMETHML